MATIIKEIELEANADKAWATLRDVGNAHLAFPGDLTESRLDGDVRTVTFANGQVVRERIVTIDDARRRLAYGVIEGRFSHHSASIEVIEAGPQRCRVLWTNDFLPNESAAVVAPLVEHGAAALQRATKG
jgi:hypothetical protein